MNNSDDDVNSTGNLLGDNQGQDGYDLKEIVIDKINPQFQKESVLPNHQSIDIDKLFSRKAVKNNNISGEENALPEKKNDQDIEKLKTDIDAVLKQKLFQWEDVSSWDFKLPETVFTGEEAPVTFFQQIQEIGSYPLSKLSENQLAMIKEKGEFIVKNDSGNDLGTTWKMNPWIIKGREKIHETFLHTLAFSWSQILEIPKRLTPKYSKTERWCYQIITPNLINGLRSVVSIVEKVANLTLGVAKVEMYTDEQILIELFKEHNEEIVQTHFQDIANSFFRFVDDIDQPYSQADSEQIREQRRKRKDDLSKFNEEFRTKVYKLESEKLAQLEKGDGDQDEVLVQILNEKQKLLFFMMAEKIQPENVEVRNHLIALIKAVQITELFYERLRGKIAVRYSEIEKEVQKNYPVRSLVYDWFKKKIEQQMKPITQDLVNRCNSEIIEEFNKLGLKDQIFLLQRYNEFQSNQKQILAKNRSRIQHKTTQPCRVFTTVQDILGERRILSNTNSDGSLFYSEESTKTYETRTDFFGWRFVLQLVRWKVWSINVFRILISNLIDGEFGLKSLCYSRPFFSSYVKPEDEKQDVSKFFNFFQYIDSRTGQRIPDNSVNPFLEVLRNICRGITRSRNQFEALPDRGIFGKKFARICNLIECYLFRAIIGTLIVLIGMPILVVGNCILSAVFAVTSWLWIPFVIVICWVFSILIYDCDSQRQSYEFFPLIIAVLEAVVGAVAIVLSLVCAFAIHPLLCILGVLIALGRITLSTLSDILMCAITGYIGRQPEINSCVAWKVRGTGVTQQYVDSMEIDDVKFLIRSWLEKEELDVWIAKLKERINEPRVLYSEYVEGLFSQYGQSRGHNQYLSQNIENLNTLLDKQYQIRRDKLPALPHCNVKFTDDEMARLMPACQAIIQSFVVSHNLSSSIFKSKCIDEGDFLKLTETALVDLFRDENILFPTSELDKRIEIISTKKTKYNEIKRAIEGEADLKVLTSTIAPRYRKFKKTQICLFIDEQVVENHTRQANQYDVPTILISENPSRKCFFLPFKDFKKTENNGARGSQLAR